MIVLEQPCVRVQLERVGQSPVVAGLPGGGHALGQPGPARRDVQIRLHEPEDVQAATGDLRVAHLACQSQALLGGVVGGRHVGGVDAQVGEAPECLRSRC